MCGLFVRHWTWPLAIMLSADWVPVKSTRSFAQWHKWVVPTYGADWRGCVIRSLPFPTSLCGTFARVFTLCRLSQRCSICLIPRHHGPGHAGDLVGESDSSDLR